MDHLEIQGRQVPKIGFGTWQLRQDDCYDGVRDALDLGYRHIDTAQAYENEDKVGDALRDSDVARTDVFVTTKVSRKNLRRDEVFESTELSLRKLRTEYIDLLLIHWPDEDVPLRETLQAMVELKEKGKVRQIGVSNFTPGLVERAREITPIACNQVEYHPFLDQSELVEQAAGYGMMLTAYSPLARQRVTDDEVLNEIASEVGKTPAQVSLRWLIQQHPVAAIPKASGADHRRENIDVFDFELSSDQMERINDLAGSDRIIDPPWAPSWAA